MFIVDSRKVDIEGLRTSYMIHSTLLSRVYVKQYELNKLNDIQNARLRGTERRIRMYMQFLSRGNAYYDITPAQLKSFFINEMELKEEDLINKKGKVSTDKFVISRLGNRRELADFCYCLTQRTDIATTTSLGVSMESSLCKEEGVTNRFNLPLCFIPFSYERTSTSRMSTYRLNLQQIPEDYFKLIEAPKDYFLLWADFSQADLRNMTNIFTASGDSKLKEAIVEFGDYYKAYASRISENGKFNEEEFVANRDDYKTAILALFYGSKPESVYQTLSNRGVGEKLHKYITSMDLYKKYRGKIEKLIEAGSPFRMRSYFGTESLNALVSHDLLTSALNHPIQATSADLVVLMAMEARNRLEKHFSEEELKEKFIFYLNRHDEELFLVHKDLLPYMYEVISSLTIKVDDWLPLGLKWSAGYNYKVDDEDIINLINQNVEEHSQEVEETYNKGIENFHRDFTGFPKLINLSYIKIEGNDVIHIFHNKETNNYFTILSSSIYNRETFFKFVKSVINTDETLSEDFLYLLETDNADSECEYRYDNYVIRTVYNNNSMSLINLNGVKNELIQITLERFGLPNSYNKENSAIRGSSVGCYKFKN